jgi:TonB family protein
MDVQKKEVNTKFTQNILVVFLVLALFAVLLWVVLTPRKASEPTPPEKAQVAQEVVTPVSPVETVEPVRAVGEIKPPKLVKEVAPVYPEVARQSRVEGIVILEATTDIYGRVETIKVLRSIPLLDQSAIDAVKQWVYEPMIIDGKARPVIFTVTVRFQLE